VSTETKDCELKSLEKLPAQCTNSMEFYILGAVVECITRLSHRLGVWTLVYHDKILCPWVKGFPSNPLKNYFADIGSTSVKTVADR